MPVEETLTKINEDGYDYTQEELEAFDTISVNAPQGEGELNVEALEGVAGGANGWNC